MGPWRSRLQEQAVTWSWRQQSQLRFFLLSHPKVETYILYFWDPTQHEFDTFHFYFGQSPLWNQYTYLPHSRLGACRLPETCQLAARGRLNWTPNIQNSPTTGEIWMENSPQTVENKCKWTWKDFSAKRANQVLEKNE